MFYSQDKQDEFLEKTVFKGFKKGVFMDIGAHDGVSLNNTLYFEKYNDWTGYNVEPIKEVYDKLVVNRPNCVNINCAVCNKDGEAEFLNNIGYTEMISGLKDNFDVRHLSRLEHENQQFDAETKIITVMTKRLETIFDRYNIRNINYLSIDVEGAEFEVIKSINFEKVHIDVIGFENNYSDVSVPIVKYLEDKGYFIFHSSMDIFMIHRDSDFVENIN